MKKEYEDWIKDNVDEPYGACKEFSNKMKNQFPELTLIRGHYYCLTWGERSHWWLQDPDGNIVDPTAAQFPSKGIGKYVPWDESQPEPTGICANCNEYCYDYDYFCSKECKRIVISELNYGR